LAHKLEISDGTSTNDKQGVVFPAEFLLKLVEINHVYPDWLLTGKCGRYSTS
jgi:hypothetical protein